MVRGPSHQRQLRGQRRRADAGPAHARCLAPAGGPRAERRAAESTRALCSASVERRRRFAASTTTTGWVGRGRGGKASTTTVHAVGTEEEVAEAGSSAESQGAQTYDLAVVGAGPSGLAVAERVASSGRRVCVIDPDPTSVWPNNYGVWIDEFEALGLEDCLDVTWDEATVFLDSDRESEKTLRRPYGRVNRKKLKSRLYEGCVANGVHFKSTIAKDVRNFASPRSKDPAMKAFHASTDAVPLAASGYSAIDCGDGTEVKARLVLDATGHAKKFVQFREDYDPGYQGAYGILVDVDEHPFDLNKMLFMDWRDDHLADHPEIKRRNDATPTFLYAMPFSETRIFLEETSLVARPAVPFDDLKERMRARLAHLDIKVNKVHEEEFCLIPMGSSLPYVPQRILGIGGTAGMVHPSTGYMISRMLGAAPEIADAIIDALGGGQPKIGEAAALPRPTDAAAAAMAETGNEATAMSTDLWETIWPEERLSQREFFNFGMEVLLTLDLRATRAFFSAFFSLSEFHWQGFLSSRLSLSELIVFGLSLFSKSSWEMRLSLVAKGLPGLIGLLTEVVRGPDDKFKSK